MEIQRRTLKLPARQRQEDQDLEEIADLIASAVRETERARLEQFTANGVDLGTLRVYATLMIRWYRQRGGLQWYAPPAART